MLRVRFPNGYTLTYNTGWFVHWGGPGNPNCIYDKKGGALIAAAPPEALLEWVRPCVISKPHEAEDLDNAVKAVADALDEQPSLNGSRHRLADIKRALRDFDARTMDWR